MSVLATHLPPDAAVYRIGPDDHIWSREVQAIVTLADVVRRIVDKNAPLLPRPGDSFRQESQVDRAMARAARFKNRQERS